MFFIMILSTNIAEVKKNEGKAQFEGINAYFRRFDIAVTVHIVDIISHVYLPISMVKWPKQRRFFYSFATKGPGKGWGKVKSLFKVYGYTDSVWPYR